MESSFPLAVEDSTCNHEEGCQHCELPTSWRLWKINKDIIIYDIKYKNEYYWSECNIKSFFYIMIKYHLMILKYQYFVIELWGEHENIWSDHVKLTVMVCCE